MNKEVRTLACLLQAMLGRKLVVELRNDTIIRGTIDEADDYMKWVLVEASAHSHACLTFVNAWCLQPQHVLCLKSDFAG